MAAKDAKMRSHPRQRYFREGWRR